jgi:hypothetical protein
LLCFKHNFWCDAYYLINTPLLCQGKFKTFLNKNFMHHKKLKCFSATYIILTLICCFVKSLKHFLDNTFDISFENSRPKFATFYILTSLYKSVKKF